MSSTASSRVPSASGTSAPKSGGSSTPAKGALTAAQRKAKNLLEVEYPKDLYIAIGAFIALIALVRIVSLVNAWITTRGKRSTNGANERSAEPVSPGSRGKVSLRRLPQAALSTFRILAFRTTVPIGTAAVMCLSEFSVVATYIAALLILNFVHTYDLVTGLWEDRAGHLAASQLSLVIALSGKNNLISYVTGISHEKLNVVHRFAGRSIVLLAWLHAFARNETGLTGYFSLHKDWMKSGVLSLVAVSLLAALSIRPIRKAAYEFFLISHIILIIITIAGAYYHRPEVRYYYWPAIAVWGFDRTFRFLRLIGINRIWRGTKSTSCQAKVELLSPDTTRLSFKRNMTWKAGQHIYVILPSVSTLPFEAHPFTIASIPQSLDGSASPKEKEVVCIIRGRNGFTRRLREYAHKNQVGHVTAFLDGPYGVPPEIQSYSSVVLIGGGSGVSFTLPLLLDVVSKVRAGKSLVRRVVFVWVVRDEVHLKWISSILASAIEAAPSGLAIETRIYLTGARGSLPTLRNSDDDVSTSGSGTDDQKSMEEKKYDGVDESLVSKISNGRPDVFAILKDELEIAEGPVSVNVAGPSSLARSVRSSLGAGLTGPLSVLKGAPSVHLHVETFGVVAG